MGKHRETGFSRAVRNRIKERAGVDGRYVRCERCGVWVPDIQLHHRRPRGAGGSRRPGTNQAANGLAVGPLCHSWIERNRASALKLGLLVPSHMTPAEVAVFRHGAWVFLTDDGGIEEIPAEAANA